MMPIISGLVEDKEVTNTLINTGSPFALANADSESHPIIMSVDGDKLIVTSDGSPVSTGLGNVLPSSITDKMTGPFNTYYVALNLASGDNSDDAGEVRLSKEKGEIAYYLNPNDLHKTWNGYTFNPTLYNVMLVIPPVYWYSEMDAPTEENPTPTTGKLYMASSPDAFVSMGITADKLKDYAHTYTDRSDTENPTVGHSPAIMIGVYESFTSAGNVSVSQSDRAPSSDTAQTLANYARNGNTDVNLGTYQLWNYYQWNLWRIMGWTVMGNMDSQYMMGLGNVMLHGQKLSTGLTDSAYQKAQNDTSSVSLFIENGWGNVCEYVGDVNTTSETNTISFNVGNTLGGVNSSAKVTSVSSEPIVYDKSYPLSIPSYVGIINSTSEGFGMILEDTDYETSNVKDTIEELSLDNRTILVGGSYDTQTGDLAGSSAIKIVNWNRTYADYGSRLAYVVTDSSFTPPVGADDNFAYIMSYNVNGTIQDVQSIEDDVATSYMPDGTNLNDYWLYLDISIPQLSDATNSVDIAVGSDSILQFYNSGNVVLQTASGTVDLGRVNDVTPAPVTVTVQNGVMTYTNADSTEGTANILLYKANEGDYVYGQNVKLLNDLSQGNVYVGQFQYGVTTANGTKDIGAIGTFTSQTETEGEGEEATEVTTVAPDVALFNTANVSTSTVTSSITQGQYYATINSISIATEFSDSDSVDYTVTGFYAPKTQTYVTIERGGGLAYDILLYLPVLILVSEIAFIGYATLRPDSDFVRSLKSRF